MYNNLKRIVPVKIKIRIKFYLHQAKINFTKRFLQGNPSFPEGNLNDIETLLQEKFGNTQLNNWKHISILTPKHTYWYAELIAKELNKYEINSEIIEDISDCKTNPDAWFVLCAQIFTRLPTLGKCVIFQLEQLNQDRWLDEKYLQILDKCLAIVEYSEVNLKVLTQKRISYQKIFFLPIGIAKFHRNTESNSDLVFYGDSSSPRRQRILAELAKTKKISILDGLFDDDLIARLESAKIIVNVHYYENSLLETIRINQSLSHGVPVISEFAIDQRNYPEYQNVVKFVDLTNDRDFLTALQELTQKKFSLVQDEIQDTHSKIQLKFEYHFARMLLGLGTITLDQMSNNATTFNSQDEFCLSIPETISRFERARELPGEVFVGLRHQLGWVGCGLSYKYLAIQAKSTAKAQLVVFEDDVVFPPNYIMLKEVITSYLSTLQGKWDVFSGLISNLDSDTKVLSVETYQGYQFVTLDHMTSTVYNIFSRRGIDRLISWDENDFSLKHNTIDRYFGSMENLRVVTISPFQFGHDSMSFSTLWGFENTEYDETLKYSLKMLDEKVQEFLSSRT